MPARMRSAFKEGRLLISEEFANQLQNPSLAGTVAGKISIATTVYPIEITKVVNGEARSVVMPAAPEPALDRNRRFRILCRDLMSSWEICPPCRNWAARGTQVGLAMATTSCNNGTTELNWFQLPNTDHPVIPQNLYRMSGGASNNDRFEQIGQSWLKHAFTALQQNACGFGCTSSGTGTRLGVGCSDPYDTEPEWQSERLGFARVGESLYRRLPIDGQRITLATRTQAHRTDFWWKRAT